MSDTHNPDNFNPSPSGARDVKNSPCDEYAVEALRYVDGDLEGQELEVFRSHLESCANCQEYVEKEKALSQLLHRSRPLYSAPAELLARINAAPAQVSESPPDGRHRNYQPIFRTLALRLPSWRALAPVAFAIALCLAFVPDVVRNVRAANYVEAAVAEHRSYLSGNLPMGLQSSSPELVSVWFAQKVPFDFRLPAAGLDPDSKPVYWLTGASVVSYKGSPAALVTYGTQNEKISLLVVSSNSAVVAGGEQVRFGNLTFHYYTDSGFRVITWSNHGLSYALVSSVSGSARTSCLVCHQNMTDNSFYKTTP
jgi:anti-sigma factor RsiW